MNARRSSGEWTARHTPSLGRWLSTAWNGSHVLCLVSCRSSCVACDFYDNAPACGVDNSPNCLTDTIPLSNFCSLPLFRPHAAQFLRAASDGYETSVAAKFHFSHMKASAAFLISAIVAVAVFAVSVFGLERVCASTVAAPAQPAVKAPQIRVELPGGGHVIRAVNIRDAIQPAVILVQQSAAPALPQGPWWRNFVCGIRATDLAFLACAVFLLLFGFFQSLWIRTALRASEKSALASEKSAALADEALMSAQRPYVFLKSIEVSLTKNPINEEIQTCTLQPIWENTGTTPTKNGRSQVSWKYFERSVPADFDFADFDDLGNRILSYDAYRPLIVGPKATALSPVINLDPAILRQVRDLQGKLLIWGWVEYDEIFPGAKRHRTEFCYQVAVSGSPASHVGFSQYHLHNGVDEECSKKPTALLREAA